MKRLLLALVALATAGIVHAESYRFYYVTTKPHDVDDAVFWGFFKDDASFGTAINKGDLIVKQMVSVQLDSKGVGETDQTYALNYPQSYDKLGKPQEFTKRKVGATARIEKLPDGRFDISYAFTELETWIFYGPGTQFSQPVFNPSSSVRRTTLLIISILPDSRGDFRHYIRHDSRAFGQA
ncbi:MAG: hypothetical protein WC661_09445 [Opitutaceae bacterium]|jgi:hypothetical protein